MRSSSAIPPSAARLFRELARIHVRAQREKVARHGGTVTRCTILTELGRTKGLALRELAARLQLDNGWVSRAVDRLVKTRLIRRVVDAKDRRAVVLTLTEQGRKEYRKLEQILDTQIEDVFKRLTPGDRSSVARALESLYRAYTTDSQ